MCKKYFNCFSQNFDEEAKCPSWLQLQVDALKLDFDRFEDNHLLLPWFLGQNE